MRVQRTRRHCGRLFAVILAALAIVGCATSNRSSRDNEQASVIVVRSSGPSASSYPVGMALAGNQVITLKANDVVVLLDSRGSWTLRGPGRFRAAASASAMASSRRARFGAVRGGSALGAAAGAVIPGLSRIEGAAVGAAVSGVSGAVWADSNNDGYVDGYVYNGQYYAGTPATAAPIRPPPLMNGERDDYTSAPPPSANGRDNAYVRNPALLWRRDNDSRTNTDSSENLRHIPKLATYRGLRADASMATQSVDLDAVEVWQTTNGALTGSALTAILEQCIATSGEVGPECLAVVRAGAGEFSVVPEKARREFATIYGESNSCRRGGGGDACIEELQNAALFRALPRGGLQLSPLKMKKGKRSLFTALIRDSGEIEGREGLPSDVGFEPVPARPGQQRRITVAPYSPEMCFVLKADDPSQARIEPRTGERRTVKPPARVCMKAAHGMGSIKYDPSWWVTPLGAGKLNLSLDIEHFDDRGRMQNFPQEPRPIEIEVMGWWDELDGFLERATGTANLATNLAKAIGALIAAISAWGIWRLFKRRRSGGAES
jgi:hypothetical protein